ncbi:ribonuclease-3 [Prosthecobacter fusiformis]|uniref:Ribonuclease 3 n=1 Tax=Prosthecobacter fusiformis TaxID=48464 RepID=A0A4R7RN37_9BACT|nr:ribonuclease III [Prosthecobacter fusiformis]TDU66145.1 ribonuclease-3 [Prosthecobacter fusiformis]
MEVLESVLGYSFRDRQLLTMALTHGSVGYEAQRVQADNQRLEFLGDAVLQLLLSELLYQRLPKADEGKLTTLRSQIVSTKALANVARRLKLGSFLIMGRGEQANGGRERESTLADVLEAVAGAIYLDGGIAEAQRFARFLFSEDLEKLLVNPGDQNPKGQLQEIIQSVGPMPPQYEILGQSGPDHAKSFEASVNWMGAVLGTGSGNSKKEAETASAKAALESPTLIAQLKSLASLNIKSTKISVIKCE